MVLCLAVTVLGNNGSTGNKESSSQDRFRSNLQWLFSPEKQKDFFNTGWKGIKGDWKMPNILI